MDNFKQWEESKIQERLKNKLTQNADLRVILEETSGKLIAQTTQDRLWGIGLNKQLTVLTNPSFWSGKNTLGAMLIELRESMARQLANDRDSVSENTQCNEERKEPQPAVDNSPVMSSTCDANNQQEETRGRPATRVRRLDNQH